VGRIGENPRLNSRRDPRRNIRWRATQRFPFRVIYEVFEVEATVVIYAVMHVARHERQWKRRL
jgi:hypothetical protein